MSSKFVILCVQDYYIRHAIGVQLVYWYPSQPPTGDRRLALCAPGANPGTPHRRPDEKFRNETDNRAQNQSPGADRRRR